MASVKVAVRVRPMNRREKDLEAKFIIEMEGKKTTITNMKLPDGISGDSGRERTKTFTYDFSYFSADPKNGNYISQEWVFKDLGTDVLTSAFEGYNACVFAYGQTGSGKSYTMMGNPGDSGLIPRICEGLFSRIAEVTRRGDASFRTEVSYLEIYNERVRDLLRRKSSKTFNLRVREHPKEGPYVEDLSKHLVQNYSDVEELMDAGNINRTTAATGMNDVSSRSHAIFTINFTQAKFDAEMPCETVSKIHLVDLAGSERADATGATGVRLKEGGNINKSLVTLGNVISALADLSQDATNHLAKKKQVFVPYRDSVLTWLLKDSLGGNSKTIMIATISPADINYGETLSTLRYANRAKNIINKPTINEDTNVKLIRELRAEIARLKALLAQGNQIALLDSPTALSMEEKLQQNEARVEALTKEWTNKWNETQNILKEQTLALRKEGIGVVLDSELPHLIGIDDDLLSTGIILYHLKEGRTYVGREDAASEQDIVLHGLDLESEHCIFENLNGRVTLIPLNEAQCSVNGIQILEPSQLNQGAVILFGRTNMFRFNHPKEAAKLREKRKSGLLSSFSLSMTDLSKSCENLSAVMLYNPGLEFERQQREELEKLEHKRKMIKEMEEKQQSEKVELEKMQQEVESQRKETEIVQLHIRKQEESLKRRSLDIETRLKDLLAEKEKFEEERMREQHEIERQKKKQEEEGFVKVQQELQRLQELHSTEKAEKLEIFKELEKLTKEKDDQYMKLELEMRRLEEQEREQMKIVFRLEEQLREKQEMIQLLKQGDFLRLEEEVRVLEDVREDLLRAKECRSEGEEDPEEAEKAINTFSEFKKIQVEQLASLVGDLNQQKDRLEKEIIADRDILSRLNLPNVDNKKEDDCSLTSTPITEDGDTIKQMEYRLHCKERQLGYIKHSQLPALLDEKQRASEILDSGLLGLDKTLYQIEKEIEEKADQLTQFRATSDQLQQLQETFEFTANIARQEEKVRKKEKEILESREKQHKEALEQAVAKLERRHSALQRHSTIDVEIEEQKRKLAAMDSSQEQAGLQASLEAEQKALEQDRERLSHEIQQLKQKIQVTADPLSKNLSGAQEEKPPHATTPASPVKSQPHFLQLTDDRIHAYIEEEVQRRLQNINLPSDDLSSLNLSYSSETGKGKDNFLNSITQRKIKYELCRDLAKMLMPELNYTRFISHPLLSMDLMELSTDWDANVSDVICSNGFKLTCNFKNALADMVYLLHENTNGIKPPLGDLRLLMYTAVKVETVNAQSVYTWLALTNTSVALVHDEALPPGLWVTYSSSSTFKQINLHSLSDVRCIILTDRDNVTKMTLVFSSCDSDPSFAVEDDDLISKLVSRSLGVNPDDLADPVKITIPRYVLCGQGKDEHYEFEIKITVLEETWTVFRRYSRFREMHKTFRLKYPELIALEFPPKKLFGNKDERVIAERRSQLEKYLRNFFSVMLKSPTSPLHIDKVSLTLSKHTICEFSPFFKKGVFDYSSHGTG
ncbi:PREDICTED: kinesin-like protein KIF16B [Nanorana parkeri]|uniref:kinesin-like protein KIF16B n=1 Tax=Nanorana parkeri TaxID=125878 RepID=UPI000854637A|nr:PREDICTED: kinesin-like protein KIF16B [Nanorana parkeri]